MQVFRFFINSIPYMLICIPFEVLIRTIIFFIRKNNKININLWHEFGLLFFIMFCVGIASQTIIPKIELGSNNLIVDGNLKGEINFIPGTVFINTYKECFENGNSSYFIINFLGNICIFVPIGFGTQLLWNNVTLKKTIIIGLISSVFIELCQLPQARGTDIDDIWINVLGIIIGFSLYRLVTKNSTINCFFKKFKYIIS
ncbi:MAG: VanZ family protein [Ruminococcus sp.]|nr:VanZ family protein [Ruminococcus sp.]